MQCNGHSITNYPRTIYIKLTPTLSFKVLKMITFCLCQLSLTERIKLSPCQRSKHGNTLQNIKFSLINIIQLIYFKTSILLTIRVCGRLQIASLTAVIHSLCNALYGGPLAAGGNSHIN